MLLSPRLSPRTKLLFRIVVALVALGSLIAALAYGPARLLQRPAAWQQHPRPTTARTNTSGRITPKTLQANGKIAFVSDRDGNFEIYVMNADGTEQTRLTNNAAIDAGPSFSPDGSKIVFDSNRGGSVGIYVMKADGASQTALTSNVTDDLDPSFSPDGSKIVFVSDRDGHNQIYVMNADGTNQTRLTNNAIDDDDPMFSPDGSKIVFVSDRDGHDQIYVMNADGTNQTNLSNTPIDDDNPSFSPDGGKIVFDSNGDVFVMNADGTNRTNLTNNPGSDVAPSFSPDGSQIVFDSNRDGHDQIYVMNADGMNQTNRSNNPAFDSFPAWQTLLNCTPPPPNMVAWYRAEDSANDEIGGHNGTLQNGATTNPGFVGQAFSFDGVDDDVEVADDPVFDSATQTIDFWLKTTQSGVNAGVIGKHDQSGSTNGYAIRLSANGEVILTFKQTDPFTSSSIISDVAVNDGRFHHVAAVFQSGGATAIYIDGRLAASGTIFSLTFNATPLRFGRTLDTFYAPYNGLLDEVDIFDRALTAAEIKNIYDAKSAGKCLASPSQTITVSNTNDSGPGSLRQAMLDANASPGIQTIIFNIPGSGVHTISPTSPLPVINDAVIIDGSTQTGYSGTPLIELDGTNATVTNGINILAGGTTIRALAINRFQGHGINIDTADGNTIVSCFIGTNAAGTTALPNTAHGVALGNANNNLIGGSTAADRNVISGNGSVGVFLIGTSTNNVVIGNYLGTDVNGTADLGNTLDGVNFQGASGNRVGGTTAGERNVISGNDRSGVFCVSGANNNLIEGNYIGTNAAGTAAISSTGTGVGMQDSGGNTIGGTTAGAGNVISGWGGAAVAIGGTSATSNNVVQGNLIGTNAAGTAAIANGTGVAINGIANSNTIGGTTPAARNVISGNTNGVTIMDSTTHDNLVQGNFIGTDVGGSSAIANGHGVFIQDSQHNTIGGTSAGAGNTIASNTLAGVLVIGTAAGNQIRGNSITSNGALGIDLSDDGVTANDTGDADTGPNNLQNFPVITSAQVFGSNTQVAGTLNSEANAQFDIEFFSNPTCDASGNGEGQTFLGSTIVNTDSSGNATFNVMLATTTAAGQAVTATATKSNGDTSEFSACQTVSATPATTIFWLNAAGGNWNNAANWQDGTGANRVPTTGDNVFITLAGTYTVTLDVSPSINSLTLGGSSGIQTLDENLHTLTLAGTSAVNANGVFTLSGALNGAGDFNVSGRLNWRGQMAGTGTTNVLAGATFVIDGGQPQLIRTLNNSTTAQYNVTSSFSFGNGTFNNLAGATFDVLADKQIFSAAGTNAFNNAGTFRKATATGTLDINVPFNNTGTVNLQAGTLNFNTNGTSSGAFNGAAGTTLLLNSQTLQAASSVTAPTVNLSGTDTIAGTFNVSDTTTVSGSSTFTGNVQNAGTTLTVNGTATFNSNAITAATINLSGTINGSADVNPTATGTFNFNGVLQGTGTTNIAAGATLNLGGSQPFLGRTLNNAGTANYNVTSAMAFGNGTFNNQSGALFDVLVEKQLFQAGGTNAFNNAGTLRKLSGTDETLFGIPFSNTNTVTLQSGILNFSAGGTSTGSFTGAAGTEFKFGNANLQAASSVSAPTVSFTQGTNSVAGTYNVSGTTNVNSTTTFSGSNITSVGTALNVSATATFNSNNITAQIITLTGTINGSADVSPTATGTFNFNGILQGTGTTNIAAGATLNLGGSQPQLQRTLNNSGTANYQPTSAMAFFNGTFNNLAGATFDIKNSSQMFTSGGTNLFANAGTVRKTTSNAAMIMGVPFNNNNVVDVQTGELNVNNTGTSTGSFTGAAGTQLDLNNHTLQAASSVAVPSVKFDGTNTVAGTYNVSTDTNIASGTTTFTGNVQSVGTTLDLVGRANFNSNAVSAATINLNGQLGGSANVSVPVGGTFNFRGIMDGTGQTNIPAGATLNLDSSQPQLQRTLNNGGTANFNVTSAMAFTGATFNNQAGAIFNALVDKQIFASGGTNLFSNSGTLRKTAGAGTTDFNLPVTNGGLLEVQTGTLRLHVSYTQVAGGDTFLNGGNIQSDGIMIVQGGTLRGAGTITGTVNNNSIVSPGNAGAGLLNITGQYIQQSGASLNIELGGTSAGTQYDQLQVGGAATLDGTLNITTINGFTPTNAQSFQVLTYGSRSGSFSSVTGGFTPTYNANDLVVSLTPVVTMADLAVTQTDAPDPVTDGNQLTYTINVTNNGPDAATGVTLTETLPNGGAQPTAVVRSFTTTQGSCTQGVGQVNCNLGPLNNGATATVTIQTNINGTGTANANASVAANENDPNSANNTQGASTTVQAGVCVAPPANLVAWYTGDDHANDIQGGNHGTAQNGATFASGRVGPAFSFSGSNNEVVFIPDSDNLAITGSLTLDAWIKPSALPPTNGFGQIVFRGDDRPLLDPYTLTIDNTGAALFHIEDQSSAAVNVTSPAPLPLGVFTHVAGTLDAANGQMNLYVNGTLVAQTTTAIRPFANLSGANPGLAIGNTENPSNFAEPFPGVIDEVEVFNRAITQTEVQAIYTAGGAGKCKPTAFTVSGHVQDNLNNNLSGVTLTLGGSQAATTTSDANGNYSFANLPAGGNYTVTPSLTSYGFVPTSQTFNNLNAPQAANFTGTQQVFAIGGRITDSSNNAISGITVSLTGSTSASTTTDASGNYSFANLAGGGNYTVTPTASNFEFNPTSAPFNNLSANQTADFTATPSVNTPTGNNVTVSVGGFTVTYTTVSASGRTRATPINPTSAGAPPANTTIVTNAPAADLSTTATFAGTINVCTNVTSVNDAATFSTLRLLHREGVSLVDRTSSVNFAARTVCGQVASLSPFVIGRLLPAGTQPIAGRILDNNNHALAGVTLTLSDANNEATLITTTTDASGNYSFNAPNGGDYRITPSKLNTVFTPSAHSFLNLSAAQTGNFSATTAISITGQLLDETSHGVAGVTMILSGTVTRQTQTLPGGHYLFTDLPPGGTYTVKPEDNARLYNPARTDVPPTQSTGNTKANFNGTANPNPTPTPPIISDFAGPAPDPQVFSTGLLTQIPGSTDPLVTTTQQNGKFVITPRANTTDVSFNGIVTVDAVDFTNTSASVEVDQTANNGAQTIFAIGADERNFFRFVAEDVEPNPSQANSKRANDSPQDQTTLRQLIFQVRQAGVLQAVSGAGHVPLDPQQMRFWRFRHDAATRTMFFETSPTGIDGTWTVRGSFVLPGAVGALATELSAGTAGAVASPGQAIFDNLLVRPATQPFRVGTFRLANTTFRLNEGVNRFDLTVERTGDTNSTSAVTFATDPFDGKPCAVSDGKARARCDYQTSIGRLVFAPGETSKSVTFFITDDSYVEGDETFRVALANPSENWGITDPRFATVTIVDNDQGPVANTEQKAQAHAPAVVPQPNPVGTSAFFVRQQYLDFLEREPDAAGFNAWTNILNNCAYQGFPGPGKTGSDPSCDRITVSGAFFGSPEFQQKGFFVYRFYKASLPDLFNGGLTGRQPTYEEFLTDLNSVSGGQTAADVNARKDAFTDAWLDRPDFRALYEGLSDADFVDRLALTADVTLPNRAQLINDLATHSSDPLAYRQAHARVLRAVVENGVLYNREFNAAFVEMQYFGYLQRDPDQAGYDAWLNYLNSTGDFRTMINGFVYSFEYQSRFGTP